MRIGIPRSHVWIARTDSYGDIIWSNIYGREGVYVRCQDIQQLSENEFYLAGDRWDLGRGERPKFWMTSVDGSGNICWERTYSPESSRAAYGSSLIPQSRDRFVFAGWVSPPGGEKGYVWLLWVSPSGDSIRSKTLAGSENVRWTRACMTQDSGVIIGGLVTSQWWRGIPASAVGWLTKIDRSGDEEWQRTISIADWTDVGAVERISDQHYVIAGNSNWPAASAPWLAKIDGSGREIWRRTLKPNYYLNGANARGNTILAWSRKYFPKPDYGYEPPIVTIFGDRGESVSEWVVDLGTTDSTEAYNDCNSVIVTNDQMILIIGAQSLHSSPRRAGLLAKCDMKGEAKWVKKYDECDALVNALALPDGGYFIVGVVTGP